MPAPRYICTLNSPEHQNATAKGSFKHEFPHQYLARKLYLRRGRNTRSLRLSGIKRPRPRPSPITCATAINRPHLVLLRTNLRLQMPDIALASFERRLNLRCAVGGAARFENVVNFDSECFLSRFDVPFEEYHVRLCTSYGGAW